MGMDGFPESDWKQLRKVYDAAFIRFCETSLKKAKAIIEDGSLSPQDRYDKLSNYLKSNRKDLNSIFYTFNFSHSNAIMVLITLFNWKQITQEELSLFTAKTQARVGGNDDWL